MYRHQGNVAIALFAGLLLVSLAEARFLADNMYPRRQLLALRRVGGKVTWNDNRQVIVGATIKAYDSDTLSAKDFMGEATTNADGGYVITYEDRQWDTFDRYPDIKIEVYIGGKLYYTSSESTDTTSNSLNKPLSVPRYIATGIVKYHETCEGAVGVTATLFDSDWPTADVEMGSAQTNNDGKYSIHAPVSEWDLLGNNPDPYVVFTKDGSELGKTEIKSDTAATAMNYGTLTIWRGDKNSSALSIQNSMSDAKKQDYITVTEYGHCSPKRMVVTITVKFELSVFDPPPSNEVSRLKSMVKNGIQDNWSRTGSRAIAVSGGEKYDVYVKVVEGTSDYYPVSLHWDDGDNAKCARSNNIGLPLTTLAMWYNIGCAKKLFASTWRAAADNDFMDTAGHEWGHTILQYAEDLNYSWTHKGTSTLTQEPSSAATNFTSNPNAEIDLMKYWLPNRDGEGPPSNQTIATSEDVKRTIAIAKTTFSKYCGACPTAA